LTSTPEPDPKDVTIFCAAALLAACAELALLVEVELNVLAAVEAEVVELTALVAMVQNFRR
jgi:hypothetical protein